MTSAIQGEQAPDFELVAADGQRMALRGLRGSPVILVGAIPPLVLRTTANPGGTPMEAFDQIRAATLADRSQFLKDLSAPFYGANRPGAQVSQGLRDAIPALQSDEALLYELRLTPGKLSRCWTAKT